MRAQYVAQMISLPGSHTVLDSKPVPTFLRNIETNLNSYTRTQSCFNKGTRMCTSCNAVNIKTTRPSISDVKGSMAGVILHSTVSTPPTRQTVPHSTSLL